MKKLIAMLLTVCLLSGCSLAVSGQSVKGELVGFFVTVKLTDGDDSVQIWNEEAAGRGFFNDFSIGYKDRKLFAQRNDDASVPYEFPEGCGLSWFSYDGFKNGEPSYRSNFSSPEIAQTMLEYYPASVSHFEMEAVIYAVEGTEAVLYFNPVYQTATGEVYALNEDQPGIGVDGQQTWSYSLYQAEATKKGDLTYQNNKLELKLEYVVLPECYVIIEMDENSQPLRQAEFAPGQMPETYTPGGDAAYLILEARAGEDTLRYAYSPAEEDRNMDTFYPGDFGLCIKGYTTIQWPE